MKKSTKKMPVPAKRKGDALAPFRKHLKEGMEHLSQIFPIADEYTGDVVGIVMLYEDSPSQVKIAHMEVFEEHRRSGHGRRALEAICQCADENGITLELIAATGSKTLKQSDLEKFYRGAGFAKGETYMRREPSGE